MICERCGRETRKYNACNYCNRKICFDCIKSSKKVSKTEKSNICKDCWGNTKKRKRYKGLVVNK